jgi:hypothetical protein
MPPKAKKAKKEKKKGGDADEADDGYNIYRELIKAGDRIDTIRVE